MALTAVWNGAPAFFVLVLWAKQAYLSRALQAVSLREFPWFQSHGQWGGRGYENIAPVTLSFSIGTLMVLLTMWVSSLGTDGSQGLPVEGNSGDACKIKSYDLNYESIKGYGLMNW